MGGSCFRQAAAARFFLPPPPLLQHPCPLPFPLPDTNKTPTSQLQDQDLLNKLCEAWKHAHFFWLEASDAGMSSAATKQLEGEVVAAAKGAAAIAGPGSSRVGGEAGAGAGRASASARAGGSGGADGGGASSGGGGRAVAGGGLADAWRLMACAREEARSAAVARYNLPLLRLVLGRVLEGRAHSELLRASKGTSSGVIESQEARLGCILGEFGKTAPDGLEKAAHYRRTAVELDQESATAAQPVFDLFRQAGTGASVALSWSLSRLGRFPGVHDAAKHAGVDGIFFLLPRPLAGKVKELLDGDPAACPVLLTTGIELNDPSLSAECRAYVLRMVQFVIATGVSGLWPVSVLRCDARLRGDTATPNTLEWYLGAILSARSHWANMPLTVRRKRDLWRSFGSVLREGYTKGTAAKNEFEARYKALEQRQLVPDSGGGAAGAAGRASGGAAGEGPLDAQIGLVDRYVAELEKMLEQATKISASLPQQVVEGLAGLAEQHAGPANERRLWVAQRVAVRASRAALEHAQSAGLIEAAGGAGLAYTATGSGGTALDAAAGNDAGEFGALLGI
jgi:hypothetical protein